MFIKSTFKFREIQKSKEKVVDRLNFPSPFKSTSAPHVSVCAIIFAPFDITAPFAQRQNDLPFFSSAEWKCCSLWQLKKGSRRF
jgi:hypothetical protein